MATAQIPCGPDEQLVSGSELFKDHLAQIQQRVHTPAELRTHFVPLFDAIAAMPAAKRPESGDLPAILRLAQALAADHPVPAYGYPKTYVRIVAGEVSRETFFSLARGDPPPDAGSTGPSNPATA